MAVSAVDDARSVIQRAIAERIFPAASVDVGSGAQSLWHDSFGAPTFGDDRGVPITIDTPFDLASLTKVIATTSVLMQLAQQGAVALDEPLAAFFEEWRGADREGVSVRDLLEHASGLPARLVDPPPQSRREFEHEICSIRLECPPRTQSIYSDLGFILLGFLASDRGGGSLATQFDKVIVRPGTLTFALSQEARHRAAPTLPMDDDLRRGRLLIGEVHDNYAAALGGVAGHAGMFGTAPAIGVFARAVLSAARGNDRTPPFSSAAVAEFTCRSRIPASSRALGWDTMLPASSCGTRMSSTAFGHVGFTGTSLWIDPARDRYFVLLTNRACGGGSLDQMRDVRRAFHDALGEF